MYIYMYVQLCRHICIYACLMHTLIQFCGRVPQKLANCWFSHVVFTPSHALHVSYCTASPATSMSLTYPTHMLLMHQSRGVHIHACFLILQQAQPRPCHWPTLSICCLCISHVVFTFMHAFLLHSHVSMSLTYPLCCFCRLMRSSAELLSTSCQSARASCSTCVLLLRYLPCLYAHVNAWVHVYVSVELHTTTRSYLIWRLRLKQLYIVSTYWIARTFSQLKVPQIR